MYSQKTLIWAVSLIIGLLTMPQVAKATQLALVFDRETGHALLFRHKGNCFALLPSHVAANDRFALELPVQGAFGSGTVFLRDDDRDLALAYVEGEITRYCEDQWLGFDRDLRRLLETETSGEILRLSPEGILDRAAAKVFAVTPDMVVVKTTDDLADGRIHQSDSGSVLEINGRIVGIAQSAPNGREAAFFRIDEIIRLLGPDLDGGLALRHPSATETPAPGGFRVTGWSGSAGGSDPSVLERGMLDAAFVAPWTGDPIQIEITLDGEKSVEFQGFDLISAPSSNQSPPKTIQFEVDASAPGQQHWRSLAYQDMPPSGALSYSTGGIFARRVRITIQSIWFADRPEMRIDSIALK